MLPDFLVAGVPKAGTSALHAALVRRPRQYRGQGLWLLGVSTGMVNSVPPENVRRYVADTPSSAVLRLLLRNGGRIGHRFPVPVRRTFSRPLLALLHRQHGRRPKVTPEQRAALLPRFVPEIELLQDVSGESYADWLSLHHASNYH